MWIIGEVVLIYLSIYLFTLTKTSLNPNKLGIVAVDPWGSSAGLAYY